jgi:hypothetical protein
VTGLRSPKDIKSAKRGHDDEVGQDEAPPAQPRTPKPAAQPGDVDADLNRKRPGQRLADGDGFAHLLLGQPLFVGNELPLHLAHQRDRTTEAEKAETKEIKRKLRHAVVLVLCRLCHMDLLKAWQHHAQAKQLHLC